MDSIAQAREAARVERLRQQEEEVRREKARADSIAAAKEAAKQAEIARVREQRKENSFVSTTEKKGNDMVTTTVTDIYGTKTTYKKVAHSWGDVFYYKGEAIITEALYKTELDAARTEVNPENVKEP